MIKDEHIITKKFVTTPTLITATDLYSYTSNPFDDPMTAEARNVLSTLVSSKSGWFIDFLPGEKSTAKAKVISGTVFFTSYSPPESTSGCEVPAGKGWLYAVDLALGTSKYHWATTGDDDRGDRITLVNEQFLDAPTLIVLADDDGDSTTLDEVSGDLIVGPRIIDVNFALQTLRTYLYITE
jgi:type IV pilus assembly protein PilY1